MNGLRLAARWDALRRSFWFLPAIAMPLGALLGWGIGNLDGSVRLDFGVVSLSDRDSARGLLETIATVTVTVIGISFSVTVVALQLASQQLGPRVLRTFQADSLNKFVLSLFLGLFVYCIVVLMTLDSGASGTVPELAVAVAIALAIVAFGFFVAFIHNIVESLQASTMIRRIAGEAQRVLDAPYPSGIGDGPRDAAEAAAEVAHRSRTGTRREVRAERAGFLVTVNGEHLMEVAAGADLLVCQRLAIGEFAVTGMPLADVWSPHAVSDEVVGRVAGAFAFEQERTLLQDVAFPVRQFADVALRALSPSLNDPTTAENAMDTLADMLIRHARNEPPAAIRLDDRGTPRLVAIVPDLDSLIRLGFDQVRVAADGQPVVAARLVELLGRIEHEAAARGVRGTEAGRQMELLREGPAGETPSGPPPGAGRTPEEGIGAATRA